MFRRSNRSWLMRALIVALVASALMVFIPSTVITQAVSYVTYPAVRVGSWWTHTWHARREAKQEHHVVVGALHEASMKIAQLETKLHALEQTQALYDDIHELAAFRKQFETAASLIAPVARRELSVARQSLTLDVGASSGVKVGMVGLVCHNLIGRVTQVYPLYCKLSLITDPTVSVAAIGMSSKSTGVARGTGNSARVQFGYVDHLSPLVLGEQIVSSGEGMLFPRGFLLGTLAHDEVRGVYHNALIQPSVDLTQITHVLLVAPGDCKPVIAVPKAAPLLPVPPVAPTKSVAKKERLPIAAPTPAPVVPAIPSPQPVSTEDAVKEVAQIAEPVCEQAQPPVEEAPEQPALPETSEEHRDIVHA